MEIKKWTLRFWIIIKEIKQKLIKNLFSFENKTSNESHENEYKIYIDDVNYFEYFYDYTNVNNRKFKLTIII